MRSTGIVRRIDDLGRVAIPKELRKAMKITEGDALEFFLNSDNELTIKKYDIEPDYREMWNTIKKNNPEFAKEMGEVEEIHRKYM